MSNQVENPTMGDEAAPLTIPEVLKIGNYRWLWLAQIVSNFGDSMTHFGLILLVNQISGGSTSAIAGLLIALGLPMATIGLFAGALVDRFPRRTVMVLSDVASALLVIAFIVYAFLGMENLWFLYTVSFFHAAVNSFFTPARGALTPTVVPENGLMAANSLGQISMVLFRVIGTGTAGFVVGILGAYWAVFAIDGLTFLLSAYFISRIDISETRKIVEGDAATQVRQLMAEMGEGLRLIGSSRILTGISVGFAAAMLGLGAINVLMPVIVINELQVAETWFGLLELAQASAMILSGIFVTVLAARFKATNIAWVCLLCVGVVSFFLAPLSRLWQLFPILFAIGLVMTPMQASLSTLMQTSTDKALLGRVGSVLNAIIKVASLTSMFLAGLLAEGIGTRMVFLIGGGLVCVAAVMMGLIFRGVDLPGRDSLGNVTNKTKLQEAKT